MKLALIGGHGNTGRYVTRLLLEHTDAELVLLARQPEKLNGFVNSLGHAGARVSIEYFDASASHYDPQLLKTVKWLFILAAVADDLWRLAQWALMQQTHIIECTLSSANKTKQLKLLEPVWQQHNLCFIADAGFHPGLPAALIRAMNAEYGPLKSAQVAGHFRLPWSKMQFSPSTEDDFANELAEMVPSYFQNRKWQCNYHYMPQFDFGQQAGKTKCVPMYMAELETLPEELPELDHLGFFVAGFGPIIDYIVLPLCLVGIKMLPKRWVAKFCIWALKRFSGSQEWAHLQVKVQTRSNLTRVKQLSYTKAYELTAIPIVLTFLQLQKQPVTGVQFQANCLPQQSLWAALTSMGITISDLSALQATESA